MQNRALASRAQAGTDRRTVLEWLTFATALQIALHSFFVNEPMITIIGAAVWFAGCYWIHKGGRGGPILIAVLAAWEVVGSLFFAEEFGEGFPTWLIVTHLATVVPALVAAVMTLRNGSTEQVSPNRSSGTTAELGG
jgi:hypothetical protein